MIPSNGQLWPCLASLQHPFQFAPHIASRVNAVPLIPLKCSTILPPMGPFADRRAFAWRLAHGQPTLKPELTALQTRRTIYCMARVSVFLAVLLVVLTFNAYACVLPLQQTSEIDCTSGMEEPVRGTCDAFLELGPHSLSASSHTVPPLHLEWTWLMYLLPEAPTPLVHITESPPFTALSLHCSIHTTVLRI